MSRSNDTSIKNPALKFFQWKGADGGFKFYDKDKKENIDVPLPFQFIVLDTLSTIKGYDDNAGSGFWSNEIRNTKTDILTVRSKGGICATGLYEKVITDRNCTGAKYCQSVYIAYKEGKDLKIGNIQIQGAALGSWIEFCKKNDIYKISISVKSFTEGKKGKTIYQIPTFLVGTVSEEINAKALELDKELQIYLNAYLKNNAKESVADIPVEIDTVEPKKEVVTETIADPPIHQGSLGDEGDLF